MSFSSFVNISRKNINSSRVFCLKCITLVIQQFTSGKTTSRKSLNTHFVIVGFATATNPGKSRL